MDRNEQSMRDEIIIEYKGNYIHVRHFGLECRRMIPSWSFAHILILLGFIIEHLPHLCICPVLPDQLFLWRKFFNIKSILSRALTGKKILAWILAPPAEISLV